MRDVWHALPFPFLFSLFFISNIFIIFLIFLEIHATTLTLTKVWSEETKVGPRTDIVQMRRKEYWWKDIDEAMQTTPSSI